MIRNGSSLFHAPYRPIKNMAPKKLNSGGASYGLSEAGYDIRLKQDIRFNPALFHMTGSMVRGPQHWIDDGPLKPGNFCLASAMEEFHMPLNLVGIVHDKSTWARKGLSVFNTVIEPGWKGFLTLELVYHGSEDLMLPAGTGIAQVIFHQITDPIAYDGKYQNQEDRPVDSIFSQDDHELNDWRSYTATDCPDCGQPQYECPSGVTCDNGHGY